MSSLEEILNEAANHGIGIALSGDDQIRLSWQGPRPELFINTVKANKGQLVKYLKQHDQGISRLEARIMLSSALAELGKQNWNGFESLKSINPNLWEKLQSANAELNRTISEPEAIAEVELMLNRWKKLYLEAREHLRNAGDPFCF